MLTRFRRPAGPFLLIAAVLALSGCQAMYDDTKGWANRLEASVMKAAEDLAKGADGQRSNASGRKWVAETDDRPGAQPASSNTSIVEQTAASMAAAAEPAKTAMTQVAASEPVPSQPPSPPQPKGPIDPTGPSVSEAAGEIPLPKLKPVVAVAQKPTETVKSAVAKPAAGTPMVIHLSSLRSEQAAKKEWEALKRAFPEQLAAMNPRFTRTDIAERGVFYRILAGPLPSKQAARQVCKALKAQKQYCQVMTPAPSA